MRSIDSTVVVLASLAGLSCAVVPPAPPWVANPEAERVILMAGGMPMDPPFDNGKNCKVLGSFLMRTSVGEGTMDDRLRHAWLRAQSKVADLGGTHVDCRQAICAGGGDCHDLQNCFGYACARKEPILTVVSASQIKCPADAIQISEYGFLTAWMDGWKATCNAGQAFVCRGQLGRTDFASCKPDSGK